MKKSEEKKVRKNSNSVRVWPLVIAAFISLQFTTSFALDEHKVIGYKKITSEVKQTAKSTNLPANREVMKVWADEMIVRQNDRQIFLNNNVRMNKSNEINVTCDRSIVYYCENDCGSTTPTGKGKEGDGYQFKKIEMFSRVVLKDLEKTAYADTGVFDKMQNIMLLKGNVKLINPNGTLYGKSLVYDMLTKKGSLLGREIEIIEAAEIVKYANEEKIVLTQNPNAPIIMPTKAKAKKIFLDAPPESGRIKIIINNTKTKTDE